LYSSPNITYYGDQIKDDEMGGTCSAHGGDKEYYTQKMLVEKPERKRPPGYLDVDGRIILKWILVMEDVDWIHLAQDRDRRRDLVNIVMNLRVP
jgi:hypothetical protein